MLDCSNANKIFGRVWLRALPGADVPRITSRGLRLRYGAVMNTAECDSGAQEMLSDVRVLASCKWHALSLPLPPLSPPLHLNVQLFTFVPSLPLPFRTAGKQLVRGG